MTTSPFPHREIKTLVENKVSFLAEDTQLSIYDTYQAAEKVTLNAEQLLFCGMITGKKIMHIDDINLHQDFYPHESFIMAPNQSVQIDFPLATENAPTTCLAIEISESRIQKVADSLNYQSPILSSFGEWQYKSQLLHTHHNASTQALLKRMVSLYSENDADREFMIDLAVTELSARLLRQQTREFVFYHSRQQPDLNSMTCVCDYILGHLNEPLDIDHLAKMACMGRSKFYQQFKQHFGCTPQAFQLQQRLKKSAEFITKGMQITRAAFESGFTSSSHYCRAFKGYYGLSPQQYKSRKTN